MAQALDTQSDKLVEFWWDRVILQCRSAARASADKWASSRLRIGPTWPTKTPGLKASMGRDVDALLIDKDGVVWDRDSGQLQHRFGAHCSSSTFENFVVRNLGFVSVQFSGSSCAVKVAPAHLSFKVYMTLSELLCEIEADRYAVSLFQAGWHHLIFSECRSVLNRLLQSSNRYTCEIGERFVSCAQASSSLPRGHALSDLLDAWRESSSCLDVTAHPRLFNDRLGGRFVVIERNQDGSSLVFSRIGHGFAMYDRGWPERIIGFPVECQPDARYGQWVANFWRSAFDRAEPTLHDVGAVVRNPMANSSRRIRYTRLTLPVYDRRGMMRLLSASLVDTGVDLGVELN